MNPSEENRALRSENAELRRQLRGKPPPRPRRSAESIEIAKVLRMGLRNILENDPNRESAVAVINDWFQEENKIRQDNYNNSNKVIKDMQQELLSRNSLIDDLKTIKTRFDNAEIDDVDALTQILEVLEND
jgi:hypothetical protein